MGGPPPHQHIYSVFWRKAVTWWATDMSNLEQLASLLARRNTIDEKIAALIDRPALRGPIGEWIAQEIFKVKLAKSANRKVFDGRFTDAQLAKKTVNVKWYGRREGLLDISPGGLPDYYLVMTGPKAWATKSRPLVITEVFLFDADELVNRLRERKPSVRLGVATSVPGTRVGGGEGLSGDGARSTTNANRCAARGAEAVR